MNRYGSWNPRGTTNSEYGKFSFLQNVQQQAPTSQQSGFNLSGQQNPWGSGQEAHQCQNVHQGYYGQQQGHAYQNYYHQPSCPNAAQNQWMQQQHQRGQGQEFQDPNDSSAPRFTVQVGEEAAAAALGGKYDFQNHYAMSQNQGPPMTTAPQQANEGYGECNAQPEASVPVETDSSTQCFNHPRTPAPETTDETPAVGGQGDASENNAAEAVNEKPTQPQAPKPTKWRGLSSVKYGRHVLPSQMRGGDANQMDQIQSRMQHLQFNPQEINPSNPRMIMTKSTTALPTPSESGQDQQQSSSGPRGPRARFAAVEKPNLCGKCNKCKTIIPPDLGPSTMTFPSKSSMNVRSATAGCRSKHYLGRQDAQNFRSVQYPRDRK